MKRKESKVQFSDCSIEELREMEKIELEEHFSRPMIIMGNNLPKELTEPTKVIKIKEYEAVNKDFEDKFNHKKASDTINVDFNALCKKFGSPDEIQSIKKVQKVAKTENSQPQTNTEIQNNQVTNTVPTKQAPQRINQISRIDQDAVIASLESRIDELEGTLSKADSIISEQDSLIRNLETEKMDLQNKIIRLLEDRK
jgi:hypothetical protein